MTNRECNLETRWEWASVKAQHCSEHRLESIVSKLPDEELLRCQNQWLSSSKKQCMIASVEQVELGNISGVVNHGSCAQMDKIIVVGTRLLEKSHSSLFVAKLREGEEPEETLQCIIERTVEQLSKIKLKNEAWLSLD